jgi:chemotaxis protein MotB
MSEPQVIVKIKKKGGHGGHHGGAWKVAYADFVTAMMALFIVLWLLTQADLQLRQQIARYFRNPSVLSGGSMIGDTVTTAESGGTKPLDAMLTLVQGTGEELEALRGHARSIQTMIQEAPELSEIAKHVQVGVTDEGLEIQVVDSSTSTELLFEISSSDLKPALVALLKKLAPYLAELPNRLRIGGHTDARPFAPDSGLTNWDLAFARANVARKVLEGAGLRRDQVLAVIAYADMKPLNANDPLAAENRRLSILALKHGTGEDGSDEEAGAAPTTPDDAAAATFTPRFQIPGLPPD